MSAQQVYLQTAQKFVKKLTQETDNVKAVVLYGSVARKQAREESDIDLLIVIDGEKRIIEEKTLDIAYNLDLENKFKTFIAPLCMNVEELTSELRLNPSLADAILKEGVVLYDDGILEEIRTKIYGNS